MAAYNIEERVFLQLAPEIQMAGELRHLNICEWQTNPHVVKGVTFETMLCPIPFTSTGRRVVILFSGTSLMTYGKRSTRWWKLFCQAPQQAGKIRSIPLNRAIASLETIGFKLAYYTN